MNSIEKVLMGVCTSKKYKSNMIESRRKIQNRYAGTAVTALGRQVIFEGSGPRPPDGPLGPKSGIFLI